MTDGEMSAPPRPPDAPAPQGARRRGTLWVVLGIVAALVLCATPVAVGVAVYRSAGADSWPGPEPQASVSSGPAPSPVAGDDPRVTRDWMADRILEALGKQGDALLRGDKAGFLSVADPKSPAAGVLDRQFAALRAMRVARWKTRLDTEPAKQPDGHWRALVDVTHCFVDQECTESTVTIGTRWLDAAGGPRLVGVEPSMSGADGPRPWEVDALVVAVGKRVMVVTTPALRKQLPGVLAEAEEAAAVADRYAVGGTPPARYQVFYAGESEWKRWYGGGRPAWTAGYAIPVGNAEVDVVINAAAPQRNRLDDLLRHEMTHASSLPDKGFDASLWWLVEGIAELAAAGGTTTAQYDGIEDVRRLVRERNWNGPLQDLEIPPNAPDWEVGASYGVGYLAVRHLAERFGEPDVLAFVRATLHDGLSLDEASREVFGEPWAGLHDQCVAAIRSAAR